MQDETKINELTTLKANIWVYLDDTRGHCSRSMVGLMGLIFGGRCMEPDALEIKIEGEEKMWRKYC